MQREETGKTHQRHLQQMRQKTFRVHLQEIAQVGFHKILQSGVDPVKMFASN